MQISDRVKLYIWLDMDMCVNMWLKQGYTHYLTTHAAPHCRTSYLSKGYSQCAMSPITPLQLWGRLSDAGMRVVLNRPHPVAH